MKIELSKDEMKTIFRWLSIYSNEVDLDERDMIALNKFEKHLPTDYKGTIKIIHEKYKQNL